MFELEDFDLDDEVNLFYIYIFKIIVLEIDCGLYFKTCLMQIKISCIGIFLFYTIFILYTILYIFGSLLLYLTILKL